jgi:hypothetical protein
MEQLTEESRLKTERYESLAARSRAEIVLG